MPVVDKVHARTAAVLVGFPLLSYPLWKSRLQTPRKAGFGHGVGKLRQSSESPAQMGGVWRVGGRACVGLHLRVQHSSARPIIGQLGWKAIAEGCIALPNSQISPDSCSGGLTVKRVGV